MGSINPELITIIVAIIVVSVFEGARYYFKKNKISNEVVSKDVLEISQVVNVFATLLKGFVPNDVALFSNILNVFEQGLKLFKDASNPQINDADTTKEAVSQILSSNNIVINDDIKNAVNAGIDLAISKIKESDDSNINQVAEQPKTATVDGNSLTISNTNGENTMQVTADGNIAVKTNIIPTVEVPINSDAVTADKTIAQEIKTDNTVTVDASKDNITVTLPVASDNSQTPVQ